MLQIIYTSAASTPFSPKEHVALLKTARERNSFTGISGTRLFHLTSFLKMVEEPDTDVDRFHEKIQKSWRYKNRSTRYRHHIEAKKLQNWSMGFVGTTRQARKFEGCIKYTNLLSTMTIDGTTARKTLKKLPKGLLRRAS